MNFELLIKRHGQRGQSKEDPEKPTFVIDLKRGRLYPATRHVNIERESSENKKKIIKMKKFDYTDIRRKIFPVMKTKLIDKKSLFLINLLSQKPRELTIDEFLYELIHKTTKLNNKKFKKQLTDFYNFFSKLEVNLYEYVKYKKQKPLLQVKEMLKKEFNSDSKQFIDFISIFFYFYLIKGINFISKDKKFDLQSFDLNKEFLYLFYPAEKTDYLLPYKIEKDEIYFTSVSNLFHKKFISDKLNITFLYNLLMQGKSVDINQLFFSLFHPINNKVNLGEVITNPKPFLEDFYKFTFNLDYMSHQDLSNLFEKIFTREKIENIKKVPVNAFLFSAFLPLFSPKELTSLKTIFDDIFEKLDTAYVMGERPVPANVRLFILPKSLFTKIEIALPYMVIEKSFSWNELKRIFSKLSKQKPLYKYSLDMEILSLDDLS